jgi:hypothetical protein
MGMSEFFVAYQVLCASGRYKKSLRFTLMGERGGTPIGVFSKELNLSKLKPSALLVSKSTRGTTT